MKHSMVGLMLFLITASVWAGTFKDDFNDNNDNSWDHWGNGKWEFMNGQYVVTVLSGFVISAWGEVKWADYTAEMRVHSSLGSYVGIAIRAQDLNNCYVWALHVPTKTMSWWMRANGIWTESTRDAVPGNPREEHLYKAVVSGDQFKGYYDGELIREWQNKFFKTGRVGIAVSWAGTQATFDDFIVTGAGVQNLESAVSPQGKLATTWSTIKQNR